MNFHRDGAMRHKITKGPNYWPNRFETVPPQADAFKAQGFIQEYVILPQVFGEPLLILIRFPQQVHGVKQRLRSVKFNEHYNQAQLFYNSLAAWEKQHLINALSFELNKFDESDIIDKIIDRLAQIDMELATQVAINAGGTIPKSGKENHGKMSKFLSQAAFIPAKLTIKCVSSSYELAFDSDICV